MTVSSIPASKRFAHFIHRPLLRRALIGLFAFLLLYGAVGYFILPGIIQAQAQRILSAKLQRPASIGKVEVQPFALALTVRDVKLMEPQGEAVFASFAALTINLSSQSLLRLAPVIEAARLEKPYVHLVRTAAHRYNIDDLLKTGEDKPAQETGPARFSLNNLELVGGHIDFDDQPAKTRHVIEALDIGVPFISTLPSQVDIVVEPLLRAKANGTPLLFKGKAKPFAAQREASLDLHLAGLDLTRFVDYLPAKPAFQLASARLDMQLTANFVQPHGEPPGLNLSGNLSLKSLRLNDPQSGKTFISLPELSVTLDRTSLLEKQREVARIALNGLEVEASRSQDGDINLQRLLMLQPAKAAPHEATAATSTATTASRTAATLTAAAAAEGKAAGNPQTDALRFKLGELDVRNATIRYNNDLPVGPWFAGVEKLHATMRALAVDTGAKRISVGEVVSGSAHIQIRHDKPVAAASAEARLAAVTAGRQAAPSSAADQPSNRAPAETDRGYAVSVVKVAIDNWSARIEDRSQVQVAASTLAPIRLTMTDLSTLPSSRGRVALQLATNRNGQLAVDGTFGLSPLHADLKLNLREVDLLPLQPYVTDHVNLLLSRASLSGSGTLQLDQERQGLLRGGFKGEASLANFATQDKHSGNDFLRWKTLYFGGVDVRLQPFALAVEEVALSDFFARIIIDPSGRINLQDVVRSHAGDHKSLTEAQARVEANGLVKGAEPSTTKGTEKGPAEDVVKDPTKSSSKDAANYAADKAAGSDIGAEAAQDMRQGSGSAVAVAAISASTAAGVGQMAARAPAPPENVAPIKIGKLTLQGGRVRFTDNFIKPNYTANLMGLGGVISGMSSDPDSSATVDLRGQVNSAPLAVSGRINPLKGDLSLDLQAKVRDMELAPLSPYSGRYVGYGIEKGKLSFDVAYKIDKRRLTADNRLILDQLKFGDKVDNANAGSLPVHLAVALLRDRDGVIDLNLPVEGSLDDPQFSIGAIIGKVIVNAITKAVTAPFALLGSLFGGGSEELAYLEFTPGRAAIAPEGEAKLKSIAKALTERPGLKLEITAHTGTDGEIEGMKRAAIMRKVRALKVKGMEQRGEAIPAGGVEVKPEEYAGLLARVYKEEKFPKPRNVIGLQKELPVAEMEKLMMANTEIDEDDLTSLGNRRAQAVKDWLLKHGQIPGERIFILATKTSVPEAKSDKEPGPSRVDFSLR